MKFRVCAVLVLSALLLATASLAKQPADNHKNVHGFVLGRNDVPLPGAVVYIKNLRTKTTETRIAEKDGVYRIPGLPQNIDFELWGEYGGAKSDVKLLSSMDVRTDIEVKLHVDVAK